MNRWRSWAHYASGSQWRAMRRLGRGLLGLGVAGWMVGAACQRGEVDSDSRRTDDGSRTSANVELPMTGEAFEATFAAPSEAPFAAPYAASEGVVAWIDDEPVMIAEARALLGRGGHDPAQRRMAVEGAIARRLVARAERAEQGPPDAGAAPDDGSRPEYRERTAALADPVFGIDALFARFRDGLSLSEGELRDHYHRTRSRYLARQIRLRRQVLEPDSAAVLSAATAATVATVAAAAAAIAPSAAATSETALPELDPTLSEVVGPALLRDLPGSLLPEVLELKTIGERIVIERNAAGECPCENQATLVELLEILPAAPLPFERVREQVEASLRTLRGQEAMRARLAELRAESVIAIDESALTDDDLWKTAGASPPARTSNSGSRRDSGVRARAGTRSRVVGRPEALAVFEHTVVLPAQSLGLDRPDLVLR